MFFKDSNHQFVYFYKAPDQELTQRQYEALVKVVDEDYNDSTYRSTVDGLVTTAGTLDNVRIQDLINAGTNTKAYIDTHITPSTDPIEREINTRNLYYAIDKPYKALLKKKLEKEQTTLNEIDQPLNSAHQAISTAYRQSVETLNAAKQYFKTTTEFQGLEKQYKVLFDLTDKNGLLDKLKKGQVFNLGGLRIDNTMTWDQIDTAINSWADSNYRSIADSITSKKDYKLDEPVRPTETGKPPQSYQNELKDYSEDKRRYDRQIEATDRLKSQIGNQKLTFDNILRDLSNSLKEIPTPPSDFKKASDRIDVLSKLEPVLAEPNDSHRYTVTNFDNSPTAPQGLARLQLQRGRRSLTGDVVTIGGVTAPITTDNDKLDYLTWATVNKDSGQILDSQKEALQSFSEDGMVFLRTNIYMDPARHAPSIIDNFFTTAPLAIPNPHYYDILRHGPDAFKNYFSSLPNPEAKTRLLQAAWFFGIQFTSFSDLETKVFKQLAEDYALTKPVETPEQIEEQTKYAKSLYGYRSSRLITDEDNLDEARSNMLDRARLDIYNKVRSEYADKDLKNPQIRAELAAKVAKEMFAVRHEALLERQKRRTKIPFLKSLKKFEARPWLRSSIAAGLGVPLGIGAATIGGPILVGMFALSAAEATTSFMQGVINKFRAGSEHVLTTVGVKKRVSGNPRNVNNTIGDRDPSEVNQNIDLTRHLARRIALGESVDAKFNEDKGNTELLATNLASYRDHMKTTNELWKRNREEVQSDIAANISRIKMTNPSQSNDQVIFEAIASHYRDAEGASEYDFFKELEEETGWRKFGLGLKWGARIMTGLPIIAAVTAPVAKALSLEAFGKGVMYGVPTAAAAAGGSYIAYQRAYENHQTI